MQINTDQRGNSPNWHFMDFISDKYVLKGKIAVLAKDLLEWAIFMQKGDRRVALYECEEYSVSTVFLGMNHSISGDPLLFETAVFIEGGVINMDRYFTWGEAEEGHKKILETIEGVRKSSGDEMKTLLERMRAKI